LLGKPPPEVKPKQPGYGQFGIGLKEAIAALMRHGATVCIESMTSSYIFSFRVGTFGRDGETLGEKGTKSLHVNITAPRRASGTSILVSNITGAPHTMDELVNKVKSSFIRLMPTPMPGPIATMGKLLC
jgi:hypothetical protein